MNKSELLTDLEGKVIRLIGAPDFENEVDGIKTYTQNVFEMEGLNKARKNRIAFYVMDEGTATEAAFYRDTVQLPKADNEEAITYLGGLKANGTIDGFEMEKMRSDLGPFSFFTATVWVDDGNGNLLEKRWRVARDGAGNPSHKEIV